MPVPAALSETSMAAAPGAPWKPCTGLQAVQRVMPVSSYAGKVREVLDEGRTDPVEQHHEL